MKKIILSVFLLFLFNFYIQASDPTIWEVNTRSEILRGEAKGVSVTDTGAIVLAPQLNEVFNTRQSYIWSSAVDTAGNVYLGTGNEGKIFKSDASGKSDLFADLAELDVTALATGRDGSLYAGTSPDGKVYKIDKSGKAEVFFDSADKYVWSLAVLNDGSLAVGTGENGKIYKVKTAGASPESSLLFDSSDTHIISLTTDKAGNLYAGTDSNGFVLRISPDGKVFALLDAALREVHDLSVGPDNSVYALVLSDSASASRSNPATVTGTDPDGTSVVVAVTGTEAAAVPEPQPKSRYDLTGAKSAVYRILPDGSSQIVWSSASVTGFSILANPNGGVYIGTSDKGRIYSVTNDGRETLLLQSNEGQVSTLKTKGNSFIATTSNQGKVYSFGAQTVSEGIYESPVRDAKNTALWGNLRRRATGNVQIQTRSGNTAKPDETWSDWTPLSAAETIGIASPKARFLQYRAVLKGSGSLTEVNVSYLANNIAPEVLSIQTIVPNVALLPMPAPVVDPAAEAAGIDPAALGLPAAMPQVMPARRIFQRGARALQWTAEDRNGDKMEYAIYYRAADEQNFKLLRENFRENFFTLDGLALADGTYYFKVVAKDTPSNPPGLALSGERISEAVEIDNTPPRVSSAGTPQISGNTARVYFEATDSGSWLNRAEYSVDGGEWQPIYANDGISDSAREQYTFDVPLKTPGEYSVALRVFDANGNAGTARVIVRKP